MGFGKKWNAFWSPSVALAFDRESLWSVNDPMAEPRRSAACVAVREKDRKVVLAGDEAARVQAGGGTGVNVIQYSRRGTLIDYDAAEAAIRHELRIQMGSRLRLTPRVLVATSQGDTEKRVVKDALIHAGARDVITIPRLMAAAIGTGLDVQQSKAETLIYVDRDWCGVAVIGRAEILASWESSGALEQVLVERAWRGRKAGDDAAVDFDAMYRRLMDRGVEMDPACEAYVRGVWEQYRILLGKLSAADAKEARAGQIHLVGPCAQIPGLKALFATIGGRAVVVPPRAEAVVILGCRSVLSEIGWILKSVK